MPSGSDSTARAIAISILALVLFDMMGLLIKTLSPRYSAAELSAYRNFFGLIPSALALWRSAAWRRGDRPLAIRQWPARPMLPGGASSGSPAAVKRST